MTVVAAVGWLSVGAVAVTVGLPGVVMRARVVVGDGLDNLRALIGQVISDMVAMLVDPDTNLVVTGINSLVAAVIVSDAHVEFAILLAGDPEEDGLTCVVRVVASVEVVILRLV